MNNHFLLRFFFIFCICSAISHFAFAANPKQENKEKQTCFDNYSFYEKPSLEEFEKALSCRTTELEAMPEQHKIGVRNIHIVFLTAALKEHPDYIPIIIKKFSKYSPAEKLLLANTLVSLKGKDVLKELNYDGPIEATVDLEDVNKIQLIEDERVLYNADHLWAAFEATGKEEYLINILTYLSSKPEEMRVIAFEMINRDKLAYLQKAMTMPYKEAMEKASKNEIQPDPPNYSDLRQYVEEKSKVDPEYTWIKVGNYYIILNSMLSRVQRKPDIAKKVDKLIQEESRLEYRGKGPLSPQEQKQVMSAKRPFKFSFLT